MANYECNCCGAEFNGEPLIIMTLNEFLDGIQDSHNSLLENRKQLVDRFQTLNALFSYYDDLYLIDIIELSRFVLEHSDGYYNRKV